MIDGLRLAHCWNYWEKMVPGIYGYVGMQEFLAHVLLTVGKLRYQDQIKQLPFKYIYQVLLCQALHLLMILMIGLSWQVLWWFLLKQDVGGSMAQSYGKGMGCFGLVKGFNTKTCIPHVDNEPRQVTH